MAPAPKNITSPANNTLPNIEPAFPSIKVVARSCYSDPSGDGCLIRNQPRCDRYISFLSHPFVRRGNDEVDAVLPYIMDPIARLHYIAETRIVQRHVSIDNRFNN